MANCKYCKGYIEWVDNPDREGKKMAIDPRGGKRHNCDLELKCEKCGETFRGSPWMKTCRGCWKPQRSTEYVPTPADERQAAMFDDSNDDKVPF